MIPTTVVSHFLDDYERNGKYTGKKLLLTTSDCRLLRTLHANNLHYLTWDLPLVYKLNLHRITKIDNAMHVVCFEDQKG